jgi:hypothetical protein
MPVSIVYGTNGKPAASQELTDAFNRFPDLEGELFVGFPVFGGSLEVNAADAIFLSKKYGPVLIDLVEGADTSDYVARQDDLVRLLHARLMQHRELVSKRRLKVDPVSITFAPALATRRTELDDTNPIVNSETLLAGLEALGTVHLPDTV